MSRYFPAAPHRAPRLASRRFASVPLIGLLLAGFAFSPRVTAAAAPSLSDFKTAQKRCESVIGRITAATVGIINSDTPNPNALAYGSGVVVSEDGLVLTAAHVIGKANGPLIILFADGRRAAAVALGADRVRDAGMARITEKGKWPFVEMGHSAAMKPGDWCLAMGHPGGVEEGRTPPLRLGRILGAIAGTGPGGYIFSDTTIISGDSGGPLFDLDGKIIGIHSSISGLVTQNNHVPIDTYRELWKDLLAGKQTGNRPQPPAAVPGGVPFGAEDARALGERFHRLLQQRLQAGDPEAKTMVSKGQIQVGVDKARELIAKWEAAEAANAKLDVLAFQRRLEERLLAGDHDVLAQVKDGKLLLSPGQMVALDKQWELDEFPRIAAADGVDLQQFHRTLLDRALSGDAEAAAMFRTGGKIGTLPDIKEMLAKWAKQPLPSSSGLTAGDLDEFLKHAKFQLDGRIDLNFPGRLQGRFMPLLVQLGLVPTGAELQSGKAQPEVLSAVASVVAGVSPSVVQVLCDGRQAGLGTVVRNDGYIVTKASELSGKITCQIGNRELPATIVKSNDFDMALLKVDADNLTPVVWSDGEGPPVGAWIVAAGSNGKPLALGIASIASRPIPKGPRMILRNAAALGVQLDNRSDGAAKLSGVAAGSPAEKAGLKAGDTIAALNGKPVANSGALREALGKFAVGDKVTLDITRGDPKKPEKKQFTVALGAASQFAYQPGENASHGLDALSSIGGSVSRRNNNFPLALTHDAVIQATQCGGPIVDLDSRVVGLNIARADRTATYAIPAVKAKSLIAEMLPK